MPMPLKKCMVIFYTNGFETFIWQGVIEPERLFEQPFNKYHDEGVAGIFSKDAQKVLSMVKETNQRALA